ncbi:hypothetical protein THIOM_001318 [Candidatus Thiomargarita nelsonii]|uniref:Uncharacterized protein n=1 Tax=Candidatus Thiomargarita nelsonii TaxID=1003181 RepID=A0A0A6P169_9GAMM|nr:hypothetical protein THIOM_001318 [Candidatus Thiomargarita nelsonii]
MPKPSACYTGTFYYAEKSFWGLVAATNFSRDSLHSCDFTSLKTVDFFKITNEVLIMKEVILISCFFIEIPDNDTHLCLRLSEPKGLCHYG